MISRPTAFPHTMLCILALVSGLTPRVCCSQGGLERAAREGLLRSAVQEYVQRLPVKDPRPSWYMHSFVGLVGPEDRQAIVYLTGEGWCGSGGCTLLILTFEGSSYKVISRIPATGLPIRRLLTTSRGWHDLAVWRRGGGVQGHEERLRFDGQGYWWDSSDSAGAPTVENLRGKIVLSYKDRESPLYP